MGVFCIMEKNEYSLDKCSECGRIQVDEEHGFWLDRQENPKAYDSIVEDYKRGIVYGLCPEDAETWKKIYNM